MGIDISHQVVVGYDFSEADLESMRTTVPEKSHYEDRYCSRTGQKLEPVKVIDEPEYHIYKFNNEEFECLDEFLEYLEYGAKLDFTVHSYGCWMGGERRVVFGIGDETKYVDAKHNPKHESILLDEVINKKEKYEQLAETLRGFGLKPGPIEIVSAFSIS